MAGDEKTRPITCHADLGHSVRAESRTSQHLQVLGTFGTESTVNVSDGPRTDCGRVRDRPLPPLFARIAGARTHCDATCPLCSSSRRFKSSYSRCPSPSGASYTRTGTTALSGPGLVRTWSRSQTSKRTSSAICSPCGRTASSTSAASGTTSSGTPTCSGMRRAAPTLPRRSRSRSPASE